MSPLRIVFFGTPKFAVPTLEALFDSHHVVCGVVTQPDRPRGRGQRVSDAPVKALAVERAAPLIQPDRLRDAAVAGQLRAWRPDLGVVAAYGKIIPADLLAIPRLGMINVHASLLPQYRGAAPVQRAVIDGVQVTGVTIMRVVPELDAGGMLATSIRPVDPDETAEVVESDLASLGATLLMTVVDALETGRVHEEPQDAAVATYAPRLTKTEGLVDWALSARAIHDRVRGLYPWPHAYTFLGGARLILRRTRVEEGPAGADPGTVVEATAESIRVAAGGGGVVALLEVQPEGKRAMAVSSFLTGHVVRVGDRFAGR